MPEPAADRDLRIRLAAFDGLREQADLYDGVLPWTVLSKGFEFKGARVRRDASPAGEGRQSLEPPAPDAGADARSSYITRAFQARLYQRAFRERVLGAYKTQCALCRLRHDELLDAAYDRHFLTVTPAYVIEVRPSILAEEDGPMLPHGLKEMHGWEIYLPRDREHHPDRERLERRCRRFRAAG